MKKPYIFLILIIFQSMSQEVMAQEAFTCEDAMEINIGGLYFEPPPGGHTVHGQEFWLKVDNQTKRDLYFEYEEYGWAPLELYKGEDCNNLKLIQQSSNSVFVHFKDLEKGSYYIKFLRHGKPGIFLIDTVPGIPICSKQISDDLQELPDGYIYNTSYYGQDTAYLYWYDEIVAYYKCPCGNRSINEKRLLIGENIIRWSVLDFYYPIEYAGAAIFDFKENDVIWWYKIGKCSSYNLLRSNLQDKASMLSGLNQDDTLFVWGIQPTATENRLFFNFKKQQEIIFNQPPDILLSSGSFALPELSSAGLPIQYEILSGNAKIYPGLLELNAAGPVTIKASQPGNEYYDSAKSVTHTFCMLPDKPIITMNHISSTSVINLISSNPAGNQWYKNGELIANSNDYFLPVTLHSVEETYLVITNIDGCQSEMSDAFMVTSIPEFLHEQAIYPNPATSSLKVEISQNTNPELVQVYSLAGHLHHASWKIIHQSGKTFVELHTASLPTGSYLIKIKTNDQITSDRFMKK